jgi:hypothetical protein
VVLAAPFLEHGLTFGVVGDIHIRVCMSNPVTKGCVLLPPRFAQRAGRRSQVCFSRHLV